MAKKLEKKDLKDVKPANSASAFVIGVAANMVFAGMARHIFASSGVEGIAAGAVSGLGLGLFIAKTLLARTGGEITFANGGRPGRGKARERGGAIAEVSWPRAAIAAETGGAMGDNLPIS